MRYLVVIERGNSNFGAYVPDLPGCVAVGDSQEEVLERIEKAIQMHLDGMREDGEPIPQPSSAPVYIDVPA